MTNTSSDVLRFWNVNKCQSENMQDIARQLPLVPRSNTSQEWSHKASWTDILLVIGLEAIISGPEVLFQNLRRDEIRG